MTNEPTTTTTTTITPFIARHYRIYRACGASAVKAIAAARVELEWTLAEFAEKARMIERKNGKETVAQVRETGKGKWRDVMTVKGSVEQWGARQVRLMRAGVEALATAGK